MVTHLVVGAPVVLLSEGCVHGEDGFVGLLPGLPVNGAVSEVRMRRHGGVTCGAKRVDGFRGTGRYGKGGESVVRDCAS